MLDLYLPIRTVSESNCFEHWRTKHKRHKAQKEAVTLALQTHRPIIIFPCDITFTRIAPRRLDDDNLVSSMKWIRDAVCEYIRPGLAIGQADNSKEISFKYNQEKGKPKEYAIRIVIK